MRNLNPTLVVAFMGVDGSGKTTLTKYLIKKLKKNYRKYKYLHLRPYLFLTDKRTVNKNPYKQKLQSSKFKSLIRILIWLFMYRVFFFIYKKKKNQLIIFDRYAHDLLIDKKRYNFNLSKKFTEYLLGLFPKPDLWVILNAPIKIIEKRKKELTLHELKKQMHKYKNFKKKDDCAIIVDTSDQIHKNILLITSKMKSIVN